MCTGIDAEGRLEVHRPFENKMSMLMLMCFGNINSETDDLIAR